uniref:Uncharacterized protein n=1 Tax=Timema douglasi TaxID=61478 RepID=A0A7R8VFC0_TIMDO|nr:unnamed protein product [Timema douglasi]
MVVFSSVCIGGLHTIENKKGNGVIYINHTVMNPKLTELWKNVSSVSASSKRTIGNQPTVLINQNKTPDSSSQEPTNIVFSPKFHLMNLFDRIKPYFTSNVVSNEENTGNNPGGGWFNHWFGHYPALTDYHTSQSNNNNHSFPFPYRTLARLTSVRESERLRGQTGERVLPRLTLSFHIRSKTDAKLEALIGQESAPKPPPPLKDHTYKQQVHLPASGFSY